MKLKFKNEPPEPPPPTVHKCGHPLDPKKPRSCAACGQQIHAKGSFRSAKKPCLSCSTAKLADDKAEAAKRREKKDVEIAAARAAMGAGVYRLPDSARFDVSYAALDKTWRGTLTIGSKIFAAEHQAVFKLLRKLDRLARAELDLPVWPQQLSRSDQLPEGGDVV